MNAQDLNSVCQPLLSKIATLEAFDDHPKEQALHLLERGVEQMKLRAKTHGCCTQDLQEASYALAALIDEQIPLRCPKLAGKWRSALLQSLFRDNQGGSFFFDRLETILDDPDRQGVLSIYAICLALGFRGKFSEGGHEELAKVRARVRRRLSSSLPNIDLHATRSPPEAPRSRTLLSKQLILPTAVMLCLAMLCMASLRKKLDRTSETLLLQLPQVLEPGKLS